MDCVGGRLMEAQKLIVTKPQRRPYPETSQRMWVAQAAGKLETSEHEIEGVIMHFHMQWTPVQ